VVIRDTRESGEMLEAAVAAGIAAAGGEALLAGVLPTPAAPLLIDRYGFDGAVVISASHNPWADNGVKFFGPDAFKLGDEREAAIEAELKAFAQGLTPSRLGEAVPLPGRVGPLHGALEDYLRALHERFADLDLTGRRIALDCANGSAHRAGPEIFRRLGADLTVLADHPDGRNINADCGSTYLGHLQDLMRGGDHDAGFAFDGDADRVLAVDRHGAVVDGDELIALAAVHLREHDRLPGNGVVVTVMTNYGFHTSMREHDIEVATTGVGDRNVLKELRERGWALGGEQSGHIIDMNLVPSGDGIASALLTLEALAGGDLADRHAMEKLPQTLVNVRVPDREAFAAAAEVQALIEAEHAALEGRGRVLVRPSGTEPLVRVMVEAPTADEAETACARIVAAVDAALN
jgi:phosphoglucosamine mutase